MYRLVKMCPVKYFFDYYYCFKKYWESILIPSSKRVTYYAGCRFIVRQGR